ncbi:exodeoxyribonuclease III [Roseiconus nitratireducens]|uniref:Exodeoxyribonuclease III n=1 Tax=Roseiconus nitratireducens TaxID=2605748 RepID=A0A5M6D6J8_9BACT|nr:exodeoxyribonuclease III [Roseiconus nitratireducens]KAA5543164.1 exodeoxyribonuclease III [Roseiconus nitratireducens]
MKLISWNVNGIRAAMDKGFRDFVVSEQPDILCLQETKASPEQVDLTWADELGYAQTWNCALKKGYSGTSIWSRVPIRKTSLGIGASEHDNEGRVITATLDDFHLVTVYTPNSQRGLTRLNYRLQWDAAFLDYVRKLNRRKPVIFCGDVNCSHQEIDLANPKANQKNAGFTPEERASLDRVCKAGFVDAFRAFHDGPGHYSWWTYRSNARERNIGWRLDYFWVAKKFMDRVQGASIRHDVFGSDHCPVELTLHE